MAVPWVSRLLQCLPAKEEPLEFFSSGDGAAFVLAELLKSVQNLGLLYSENIDDDAIGKFFKFTSNLGINIDVDVETFDSVALLFMISVVPLVLIRIFHESLDLFEGINAGEKNKDKAWSTVRKRAWYSLLLAIAFAVPAIVLGRLKRDGWSLLTVVAGSLLFYAASNAYHIWRGEGEIQNEYKSKYPVGKSYIQRFQAGLLFVMHYVFAPLFTLWLKLTFSNEDSNKFGIIAAGPLLYQVLLFHIIQDPTDYAALQQTGSSCSAWLVGITFCQSGRFKYFGEKADDITDEPSIIRPNFWRLGTVEIIEKAIIIVTSNVLADNKVEEPEVPDLNDFTATIASTGVVLVFSVGIWLFRPYCNAVFNRINIIPRFINILFTVLSVGHAISADNKTISCVYTGILATILSCQILLWMFFAKDTSTLKATTEALENRNENQAKLRYYKIWKDVNTQEAVVNIFNTRNNVISELEWEAMPYKQRFLVLCATQVDHGPVLQTKQLKIGYKEGDTKYSEELVRFGYSSFLDLKIFKVKDIGLTISDIGILINCPSFQKLNSHLCKLSIRKNPIESEGCAALVRSLRQHDFNRLVTLTLTGCGTLNKDALTQVAEFMKHSISLRCLYLDDNEIGSDALQPIVDILLTTNVNVSTLSLTFNKLKDSALRGICETFKTESNMSNFFLWENEFSEKAKNEARVEAKRYKKKVFFSLEECEESFSV